MKSWRKFIGILTLTASLFSVVPGSSQANMCDPCNACGFEIGADFLWWKPCFDDADYAFIAEFSEQNESDTSTQIKYKTICPDWEPGFRVYLGFPNNNCDWGFLASYSYLSSKESDTTSLTDLALLSDEIFIASPLLAPFLTQNIVGFGEAKGTWDSRYQECDALISYSIPCGSCHEFVRPFNSEVRQTETLSKMNKNL